MKNSQWFAMGAIGALLMLAPVMRADGVDISVAPISGAGGSSVEVVGTVTNNTSGTVFLNGDTFSVTGPDLSLAPDTVVHCAGSVTDWGSREAMLKVNRDGTQHILDTCAAAYFAAWTDHPATTLRFTRTSRSTSR